MIEIEPLGIAPSLETSRPLVLFREIDGSRVLPVWVSPLDAGITMIQSQGQSKSPSPHDFTKELLKGLNLRLETCTFEEVVGHHQYVRLTLKGSRKLKDLKVRADHVISLCIHAGCRFYTSLDVIRKSQEVDTQLSETAVTLKAAPQIVKNPHPYLN